MTRRSQRPPNSSPLLIDLGIAVKALRREAALTQKQLSRRTGLHETYISQIECGAGNPAWTTLTRLCKGLGVPRWVLVKRIDELGEE